MDDRSRQVYQVTWLGVGINLGLTVFKIYAGMTGRSSAIIADAVHSFSDFSTDLAVLIGFKEARKPVDKSHHYGHGKIETAASTFIGLVLFLVGFRILVGGINEVAAFLMGVEVEQPKWIACFAAAVSIVSKEWLYRRTIIIGRAVKSQAVLANAWHHRSDALSSVGVLLGISGAILLGSHWRILDPLAAIFVSFFIIKAAVSVLKESVNELIEASLSEEMESAIFETIQSTPGVQFPHNLKTRRIGKDIALDFHIKVPKELTIKEAHDIASSVEARLKERFGQGSFIYIHVEPVY